MSHSSRSNEAFSGINVTPLTDVMLVLLITFLLSASSFESAQLSHPLPQVKKTQELQKHAYVLSVNQAGEPEWKKPEWKELPLVESLRELRESREEKTLALAVHRNCQYQKLFSLMEAAKEAEWSEVILLTEEEKLE